MAKAKTRSGAKSKPKAKGGAKPSIGPCRVLKLEMEVEIAALPKRVWEVLTKQTAGWWPADFYSSPGKAKMVIEPRAGGRMFEDCGKGAGAMWGLVTECHPQSVLAITGHTASKWGGPNMWILRVEFAAKGKGTRLVLVNDVVGRMDARHARDLRLGWMTLFGEALKEFAESRAR